MIGADGYIGPYYITEKPRYQQRYRGSPRKGLERREVEKRIYGEKKESRLTASASFLAIS